MKRPVFLKSEIVGLLCVLAVGILLVISACSSTTTTNEADDKMTGAAEQSLTVAIPNDSTNEGRALLLLEQQGWITLDEEAGITASVNDIVDNPHDIEFKEVEAAQIPNILQDVDYAVINSNYAIEAGLNPVEKGLAVENSSSNYANIIAVRSEDAQSDATRALVAAVESRQVAEWIDATYDGAVISVVDDPGNGYDASVDYASLAGRTISVAASPSPHAEVLKVVQEVLAAKGIRLKIDEYNDYVVPNTVVDEGEEDANYFQHLPYLTDFNAENGTDLVSVAAVHVEPMAMYGGKQTTLQALL